MTYSELLTAVASQVHRTDLEAKIPLFVQLAEGVLFRELSISELETSVSGTATETIALPSDFGELNRLEMTYGGLKQTIDYTSPNGIEAMTEATGQPVRYTVQNNAIRLIPAPSGTLTYTLFYTPVVAPLSASNTSNWILANAPDLYLYSVCVEACRYMEDDAGVARYQNFTAVLLDSVRRKDERRKFSSAGAMQIKPRNAI